MAAVTATGRAVALTLGAVRAAEEKKARRPVAIDVSQRLGLSDVFLIVSGDSDRQVHAIVDAVDDAMHEAGAARRAREGMSEARWVLVDYGDVVVHVLQDEERDFYDLERLWKDCPVITLPPSSPSTSGRQEGADDVLAWTRGAGASQG